MTDYRTNLGPVVSDASLAQEIKYYFKMSKASGPHPKSDKFRVEEHEVR